MTAPIMCDLRRTAVCVSQGDEVVLQSTFTSQGEHVKLCLAAEGFGTRLCRLEPTSNCKVKSSSSPCPFLCDCQSTFVPLLCELLSDLSYRTFKMLTYCLDVRFLQISQLFF